MTDLTASVPLTPHPYGLRKLVKRSYAETVESARQALQQEGFGVLFEIDMKAKLKEKLGVDFQSYMILGACHPPLAYETLQAEMDIGLLLPCNVIVYEQNNQTVVAAIDAAKMMSVVGNSELEANAQEINEKLRRVVENI
jgi:uncharacterized protein (DUF302 family)